MFHHPKYYKELRKRNKLAESRQPVVGGQQQSDQAISLINPDGENESVRPGPGLRSYPLSGNGGKLDSLQTLADKTKASSFKQQAASNEDQASSVKL